MVGLAHGSGWHRWIIAALRNRKFFGLAGQLNEAEMLVRLNEPLIDVNSTSMLLSVSSLFVVRCLSFGLFWAISNTTHLYRLVLGGSRENSTHAPHCLPFRLVAEHFFAIVQPPQWVVPRRSTVGGHPERPRPDEHVNFGFSRSIESEKIRLKVHKWDGPEPFDPGWQ
jgi:hypothetical protein